MQLAGRDTSKDIPAANCIPYSIQRRIRDKSPRPSHLPRFRLACTIAPFHADTFVRKKPFIRRRARESFNLSNNIYLV